MKVNDVSAKIEALEQSGIQIEFFYFRNLTWDDGPHVKELKKAGYFTLDPAAHKHKKRTVARLLRQERHVRYRNADELRPAFVSPNGGAAVCRLTTDRGQRHYGIVYFERSVLFGAIAALQVEDGEAVSPPAPRPFCYAIARAASLGRAVKNMEAGASLPIAVMEGKGLHVVTEQQASLRESYESAAEPVTWPPQEYRPLNPDEEVSYKELKSREAVHG